MWTPQASMRYVIYDYERICNLYMSKLGQDCVTNRGIKIGYGTFWCFSIG